MLQRVYTEAQGLVEDDLSVILDTFGSNQFMSCPQAMSFFQRLCPAPFPPVSKGNCGRQMGGIKGDVTGVSEFSLYLERKVQFLKAEKEAFEME